MRNLGLRNLGVATLVLALASSVAQAQSPGDRIVGTVRDARGNALEAVAVTATNTATGTVRSATTEAGGAFTISGLTPGSYNVMATRIGYGRNTRVGVPVPGPAINLVLEAVSLQAVVVTATLREQDLADVPFSIAAPSAEILRQRGAEGIEGVAVNVAGFTVQNLGPGQSQVAIRGASAGQIARDQPGVKEQVGVYLDDSPISLSLFTPDLDLFDVSRVEVLRGPQGTLFGSGSLSGTVRYITNQPQLGERSTFGEVGGNWIFGGSGGANVRLGGNLPLGERTAARVSMYHSRIAGYMDAIQPDLSINENVNSGTRTGVRAAVRFEPTERLSIVPRLVFQTVRMDGWNRIDAFNILANPFTSSRPRVTIGERQHFIQIDEPFTDEFILGDVNLRYDMGGLTFTSVTGYSYRDVLVVRDAGALTSSITGGSIGLSEEIYTLNSPLNDATGVDVITQELRLAGGDERARWLLGGFFSKNKRDYAQQLLVSGFEAGSGIPTRGLRAPRDVLFFSDLSYDLRQTALFGEGTVTLMPQLDVTAGLRYYNFKEDRDQVFDGIFANDDNGTAIVSVPGSTRADGLAPRFIASLRASDAVTFNAQAAKGFRLGGINDPLNVPLCTQQDLATFSGRDSWRDETAWNYELGAKAQLLGGRLGLNVAAFHMDITDLQLIVTAGSCSSRLVFNVPKSVSRGAEIELTAAPTDFFDFSVSATLTDAELRSTLTSTDAGGGTSVVSGIQSGNRLPSVPRVQGAASATLRRPMANGAQGFVTGTVHHVGSRFTQIDDHEPGTGTVNINSFPNTIGGPLSQTIFAFNPELPAYNLMNVRVGMTRDRWDLALFVNNLTDERALLALDRERGRRARVGYLTNQPRSVGVTMGFNY